MKKRKALDYTALGYKTSESSEVPYDRQLSGEKLAAKTKKYKYFFAGAVSLITFLVYMQSLQNAFTSWDDPRYVYENPHIWSFSLDFFRWIFFEFYAGNWHPLTWISHAADFAVWGLNPLGHHLTNNILHAVNTFMVVLLAAKLAETWNWTDLKSEQAAVMNHRRILITGGVTGLLFGLHPVHVESVAWVSERKDLLCALFFMLSILTYIKYVRAKGHEILQKHTTLGRFNISYFLCLVFFIFALLSKPMAVSLPFVLLIIDWYPYNRIHSMRSFWAVSSEKLPFILLSLGSSVLTFMAQKEGGAMEIMKAVPLQSRLLVAAHSLFAYLWKMIWPANLIPYYPYPKDSSLFSLEYLSAVALVFGITAVCVAMIKRQKLWLSVWAYYVATFIPVIGLVQVGGQSMADRYTYLPSLGPFFIVGLFSARVFSKGLRSNSGGMITRRVIALVAIILLVSMSYLTFLQIGIWKNGIVLWSYVIEKEPERIYFAYYNRGNHYDQMGQVDKAIDDYNKAISLNRDDPKVFVNRGLVYLRLGQVQLAIADFNEACKLGNSFACKAPQYFK